MEEWRQANCLLSTNNMDSDGVITTPLGSKRRTTVPWKEPPRQRLVLDSGTDYPLAGSECLVIHKHNISISFSGAIHGDPFHKRDLVDVITWIITQDGASSHMPHARWLRQMWTFLHLRCTIDDTRSHFFTPSASRVIIAIAYQINSPLSFYNVYVVHRPLILLLRPCSVHR